MDKRKAIKIVQQYIRYFKREGYKITAVFLFGSYARGTFTDDSDIDVAIVIKNLTNSFDEQVNLMKLRRKFDTRIEPHPFSQLDLKRKNPFITEILKSSMKIA